MELLTLNEIIQTIVEETKGLDPELIEDMILKEVDIPNTSIPQHYSLRSTFIY